MKAAFGVRFLRRWLLLRSDFFAAASLQPLLLGAAFGAASFLSLQPFSSR